MSKTIEQGPIRPPSEAGSLLIRVTRNCPWNKCAFCHTYRGTKFERRSNPEIISDILTVRDIVARIQDASAGLDRDPPDSRKLLDILCRQGYSPEAILPVLNWLGRGGDTVFLQDGDSLILKTPDLLEILKCIKESFPRVIRITTYCRSHTARRKTQEEMDLLAAQGLTRIHVGMESGYDPLLKFINKGSTQADHIEGGRKIKAAGISLCEYVMPGLGGKRWTKEHAQATAQAINEINPDYLRLRSLYLVRDTELFALAERGLFTALSDEETVAEIGWLLRDLSGIETTIVSDHVLNLLEEIEGKLPEDKEYLLGVIAKFFSLSEADRLIFRVGRRLGYLRRLNDLKQSPHYDFLKDWVARYEQEKPGSLEQDIARIMQGYI